MVAKSPKWESELWSFVSSGDGMRCPAYDNCQKRLSGKPCKDDKRKMLARFIESGEQFNSDDYNLLQPQKYNEMGMAFQLVEKLALKQLKSKGTHSPPVPTELAMLVDPQHVVEVRLLPLKSYHGAIWRTKERWIIQLGDNEASSTNRFTLFHEAFHILAHCGTIPVFRKRGVRQGSFNELLADYFAICILMPRKWVREKWVEVHDLDRMAGMFDVPKSTMWFRLRQTGLI